MRVPDQQGAPPGRESPSDGSRSNAGDPVPGKQQKSEHGGSDMDGMERLMNNPDEGDTTVRDKETPLQAAHPESFIVVCEAGCRPSSNKIVYEVSSVALARHDGEFWGRSPRSRRREAWRRGE